MKETSGKNQGGSLKMRRKNIAKKMFSTVLSVAMAVTLAAGYTPYAGTKSAQVTAEASTSTTNTNAATYGLTEDIGDGLILHCWNWSYKNIESEMANIAAAGYTAVQTSPVQRAKEGDSACDYTGWWKVYQPTTLSFYDGGWFGTKAEFKSMCETADKYGVKVVVDIVSNHMANISGSKGNCYDDISKENDATFYNDSSCWHLNGSTYIDYNTQYRGNSTTSLTRGFGGWPDLNTASTKVQNAVINLCKECIDLGADGFRFDAAKHIELPTDPDGSNYWPNVINGINNYAASKNENVYIYGEILDSAGTDISNYTKYMAVTDNISAEKARYGIAENNTGLAATSIINYSGQDPNKVVLWAESHDTYAGNNFHGTSSYVDQGIIKRAWAINASREYPSLYFIRPNSTSLSMGAKSTNTSWKDAEIVAVNKFHNHFSGTSEYLSYSGNIVYSVRDKKGIVLVNASSGGGSTSVNIDISATGMASGTYTDQVTGNTFTVSNGKISGSIGSTGVAVVYNATVEPEATISQAGGSFTTDTLTLTLGLKNATSGTYKIGSASAVTYTGTKTITIGSDMAVGDSVNIILTATDGSTTNTKTYVFSKVDKSAGYVAMLSLPSGWSTPVYCYAYDSTGNNGTWPGVQMTYDSSSGYYTYTVPTTLTSPKVIFTDGTNQYPGANQAGLSFSSTGSWLYKDGSWAEYKGGGKDDFEYEEGYTYFKNTSNWSTPYFYTWNKSTTVNGGAWPGKAMTVADSASGIYKCATNSAYDMIIFNNGSGTQTEDLSIPTVSSGYVNVYVYGTGWTTKQVASTKGTVVTKYVDESGNEIASSVSQTGEVGAAYTTTAATVSGYTLKTTPSNATGTYTNGTTTVTYIYTQVTEPVVTSSLASGSSFTTETTTTTLTLSNAVSGTYTVDGGVTKKFTGSAKVVLGQGLVGNKTITVDATATDSKGTTKSYKFTFTKKFTVSGSGSGGSLVTFSELSSDIYKTNATGYGVEKTISSYKDFTEDMLIAVGAANDDARAFRGPHEGPVYDDYALYAAYDDTNLYVGWQYVNTADINAADQDYPKSDNGFPDNGDIPQVLAFYVPGQQTTDGLMADGKGVWGSTITYDTKVSAIAMFSSKSGVGEPSLFTPNSSGKLSYDSDYCKGFSSLGITYSSTRKYCLPSAIYGTTGNGYTTNKVANLASSSNFVEQIAKGHDTSHDSFYMMTIPLSALGTTKSDIKSNGIGVMHISTFGVSGINSLPMDYSMVDNAEEAYSADESTSAEKEDTDEITASLASVGTSIYGGGNTAELQVNFGTDVSGPQYTGKARTLSATAYNGTAGYTYKIYADGTLLATKTSSSSTAVSTSWTPSTSGDHTIKCVVTDAAGKTVTSEKTFTTEGAVDDEAIVNTSFVSQEAVVGQKIVFKGSATGGSGEYQYAYYYRKTSDKTWTTAGTEWGTSAYATAKPGSNTVYEVCIKVRDANNTSNVVKKYLSFAANTTETSLKCYGSVYKTIYKYGTTNKITASSANASGTVKYKYEFRKASSWTYETIKDYTTSTSVSWDAPQTGSFTLRITAYDGTDYAIRTINIKVKK